MEYCAFQSIGSDAATAKPDNLCGTAFEMKHDNLYGDGGSSNFDVKKRRKLEFWYCKARELRAQNLLMLDTVFPIIKKVKRAVEKQLCRRVDVVVSASATTV